MNGRPNSHNASHNASCIEGNSKVVAVVRQELGYKVGLDRAVEYVRGHVRKHLLVGRIEEPNGHRRCGHGCGTLSR